PRLSIETEGPPSSSPVLLIALAVLLALGGIGYEADRRLIERARSEEGKELSAILNTTDRAVQDWFQAHEEVIQAWGRDPELVAAGQDLIRLEPTTEALSQAPQQGWLENRLTPILLQPEYRGFSVVSVDGVVLASSRHTELGRRLGEETQSFLRQLRENSAPSIVGLPQQGRGTDFAAMLVATALRDAGDAPIAILMLRIDPEQSFTQILRRGAIGESGESYAFNRDGKLISESRFDEDLKALGLVPEFGRSILSVDIRDPGGNLLQGHQPQLLRKDQPLTLMARSAIGSGAGRDLRGYNDYRGVPVVGAWTWDERHQLGIATEIDVTEAYDSLNQTRLLFRIALGTTSLLIMGMGALFYWMRRSQAILSAKRQQSVLSMLAAQAGREQSEERMRTVMESATDAIICSDEQGHVVLWNPAAEKMLGHSASDMRGRPFAAIIPESSLAAHDEGFRNMITSGGLLTRTAGLPVELHARHADGHEFPIELSLGCGIAEGALLVTGFIRDITRRVEMESEIHAARDKAEDANRAKSAFLANMSHELRTPMNAIIGYTEMLAEECEEDGNEEYLPDLEKVQAAGKHLLSLINDVLDLSKVEAGRMDLFTEDFFVTELVRDVVATTTPLIAKGGNRLEQDLAADLSFVHTDLTKLRQCLFNLISNASKFTKDGVVTLTASRALRGDQDWLLISVSDTGIGIPADKFEHVFEEFAQADDSTTREYGGTGLGLPLSRRLCQLMGGDLTVSSEAGVGSTFTIEIPTRVSDGEDESARPAHDELDAVGSSEETTGPSILVVDDEADARELLRRTLEADGYRVATARSGAEALESARRLRPALITLDVMMPGMDGWAVLRYLKSDPDLSSIPVVMLSIVADRELSLSLGAVESMPKPFDRAQLRHLAHRLVERPGDGSKALVVEDDEPTRELLCRNLRSEGWTVESAENGAIALERIEAELPDLIVLDLMMPVMDGFEFLAKLRLRDDAANVPVLVVTAKDLTPEDRERLKTGAQRVLQKTGFNRTQLLAQVRALTGQGSRGPQS
ncbi:MAG: PAS domain S-box-containing protein, partial [Planctomycetota bacterium]